MVSIIPLTEALALADEHPHMVDQMTQVQLHLTALAEGQEYAFR